MNPTVASDYAVAQKLLLVKPEIGGAVSDEAVELHEAAFVEQEVEPLPGGKLPLLVLLSDTLGPATLLGLGLAVVKVFEKGAGVGHGREAKRQSDGGRVRTPDFAATALLEPYCTMPLASCRFRRLVTTAGFAALALFCLIPRGAWAQEVSADSVARLDTVPQYDLMDLLSRVLRGKPKLSDTVQAKPKLVLTILPAVSASPSVGLLLGVSANAFTRFGPESTTSPSVGSASVSYTTKKQFNVLLRSNVFTSGNAWKFEGDWRYLDTNQPTFGLGPAAPESAERPRRLGVHQQLC